MSQRPFEEIVADHGEVVWRVCRALLGPDDAEDAWSDTFLAALRAYPDLQPDSNVRGWLVTIAHNKAIDRIRAGGRGSRGTDPVPEVATWDPARPDEALRVALADLPPRQRDAVVLHYLADLPYAEVGDRLGTSEAAARRSAADGVAKLRMTYSEVNR